MLHTPARDRMWAVDRAIWEEAHRMIGMGRTSPPRLQRHGKIVAPPILAPTPVPRSNYPTLSPPQIRICPALILPQPHSSLDSSARESNPIFPSCYYTKRVRSTCSPQLRETSGKDHIARPHPRLPHVLLDVGSVDKSGVDCGGEI